MWSLLVGGTLGTTVLERVKERFHAIDGVFNINYLISKRQNTVVVK
jgi:hypothetical protein